MLFESPGHFEGLYVEYAGMTGGSVPHYMDIYTFDPVKNVEYFTSLYSKYSWSKQ